MKRTAKFRELDLGTKFHVERGQGYSTKDIFVKIGPGITSENQAICISSGLNYTMDKKTIVKVLFEKTTPVDLRDKFSKNELWALWSLIVRLKSDMNSGIMEMADGHEKISIEYHYRLIARLIDFFADIDISAF